MEERGVDPDATHRDAEHRWPRGIGTGANARTCRCRVAEINRAGIFRRTLKAFIGVASPSRDSATSSRVYCFSREGRRKHERLERVHSVLSRQ